MKISRYITMFAAAAVMSMSAGCRNLEEAMTLDPSSVTPPVLNPFDVSEVVVTNETLNETVTFAWDAAQFGVRTQVNYSIEASYNDGPKVVLFSGLHGTSASITYEDLNYTLALDSQLGGLGVPLDTPTDVDYYISASIGSSPDKYYSEARPLKMTVIYAEPIYPTVWVVGDYCGWEHGRSQFLFSYNYDANYEGIINFGTKASAGFKITGAANWENSTGNWGYEGNDEAEAGSITLTNGASTNILLYSRTFYSFKYNTSTRVLTRQMAFDKVTCTIDGAEEDMLFNSSNQRFYLDKTLAGTEQISFAIVDGDNRTVLKSSEEGKLTTEGGSDITAGVTGTYRILVDLNNSSDRTYRFSSDIEDVPEEPDPGTDPEPSNTWGIVGGPNNWTAPDFEMTEEGGFLVYKGLALEASTAGDPDGKGFKIRFNNEWNDAANYGLINDGPAVTGPEGNPVESSGGSKNIWVAAGGTYDIYFNLEGRMVYVLEAGSDAPAFYTWGIWRNGQEKETDDVTMVQSGNWYVAEDVELNGEEFKIRYGFAWDQNYGLSQNLSGGFPVGEAVILNQGGGNMSGLTGKYDIYFDPAYGVIQINEADAEAPAAVSWGIVGSVTGWGTVSDLTMLSENGSFVCRNVIFTGPANGEFKIRVTGSAWNAAYGGTYGSSNVPFSVNPNGGNIIVPPGSYDIWFNSGARTVTVSATGDVPAATWGLCGTMTGWGNTPDLAMTDNGDGTYTRNNVSLTASDEFKIRYNNDWAQQYSVNGVASEGSNSATTDGGAGNTTVAEAGVYNITLDTNNSTITLMKVQ